MLDNNRTAIIRNWKEQWNRNNNLKSAQKVEQATSQYPDSKLYVSKSEYVATLTEDELTQFYIENPNYKII